MVPRSVRSFRPSALYASSRQPNRLCNAQWSCRPGDIDRLPRKHFGKACLKSVVTHSPDAPQTQAHGRIASQNQVPNFGQSDRAQSQTVRICVLKRVRDCRNDTCRPQPCSQCPGKTFTTAAYCEIQTAPQASQTCVQQRTALCWSPSTSIEAGFCFPASKRN